jgi:hypothetical protein
METILVEELPRSRLAVLLKHFSQIEELVNRLDRLLFGSCFESWIRELWPSRHDLIAIGGKTSRRTHDKRKGSRRRCRASE